MGALDCLNHSKRVDFSLEVCLVTTNATHHYTDGCRYEPKKRVWFGVLISPLTMWPRPFAIGEELILAVSLLEPHQFR